MSRAFEQPLFHGTIASIDHIDVSCGRAHKDFGESAVMTFVPVNWRMYV